MFVALTEAESTHWLLRVHLAGTRPNHEPSP